MFTAKRKVNIRHHDEKMINWDKILIKLVFVLHHIPQSFIERYLNGFLKRAKSTGSLI